jgi:hypothetical protein
MPAETLAIEIRRTHCTPIIVPLLYTRWED